MRWEKLGCVFVPDGTVPWMRTHAAVPVAEHLRGDQFRIYFSARDDAQRSHTGWVVIDLNEPQRVLEVSPEPALTPGALGAFDDSGAMGSWLVDGRFYYIGWNLGVTVPFRNSIGLAVAAENGRFERAFAGPLLDRTRDEPHFCASCCVLHDGTVWRMWYLSCVGWDLADGRPRHRYHIKYAESDDGIDWRRDGSVAIDFSGLGEYAISRPSVIRDSDVWRMWYSYRGDAYRIGYADSEDGRIWRRADERAGISTSADGWDSDMIEYPFVFDHGGKRFMLYNGNGYGRTGFGLAVAE